MLGFAVPGWSADPKKEALLKSLVLETIELFGAERCMCVRITLILNPNPNLFRPHRFEPRSCGCCCCCCCPAAALLRCHHCCCCRRCCCCRYCAADRDRRFACLLACRFASNWHINGAVSDSDGGADGPDMPTLYATFEGWVAHLPIEKQRMLFEGTAAKFYRLD